MNSERSSNRPDQDARSASADQLENRSTAPNDLPDSREDADRLRPEETVIDLPDVKDIPGQEFVHAPPAGVLGDATISSDDEEGRRVFDQDETESFVRGNEGDVSRDERQALDQTEYMPTRDENNLQKARMDQTDFENEPLNERGFGAERSGRDLDVPHSSDDTESDPGQTDEENEHYSLGSSDNDNVTEGTP